MGPAFTGQYHSGDCLWLDATEDYAFALTFPAFTAGSEGEKLEFYFEAEIDGEDAWTVIEEELDAIAGIL